MSQSLDTLKFANRLKAAGVPDKQAEAEAEAIAEVMAEAVSTSDLATKRDILDNQTATRQELHDMELRITKWVVGLALAQIGLLVPAVGSRVLVGLLLRGIH